MPSMTPRPPEGGDKKPAAKAPAARAGNGAAENGKDAEDATTAGNGQDADAATNETVLPDADATERHGALLRDATKAGDLIVDAFFVTADGEAIAAAVDATETAVGRRLAGLESDDLAAFGLADDADPADYRQRVAQRNALRRNVKAEVRHLFTVLGTRDMPRLEALAARLTGAANPFVFRRNAG